jgi:UDP-glucose 4-epimerase
MGNVVVIGANRFIGFHLCMTFLDEGTEVKGYTHSAHKEEDDLQEEMKFFLGRNANYASTEVGESLDMITSETDVVYFTYFDGGDFYHPDFLRQEMQKAQQVLIQALNKCRQFNIRFVFVSTMRVFGDQQRKIEETTIPEPDSSEGRLYVHFERMIEKYKDDGWPVMIVRTPTLYGPWQPLSMCYSKNIAGYEEAFTIMEGTDFIIYIEDAVSALRRCKTSAYSYEVVHLVEEKLQPWSAGANITHMEVKEEAVQEKYEISRKAKELLHFSSKVTAKEGIYLQKKHMRTFFLPLH